MDWPTQLRPSESVLWQGKPILWILRGPWILIPFSLLWLAFACFWELSVISGSAPVFFILWGAMFVIIGLYFAFGRLVAQYLEARATEYIVTSQRVIIDSRRQWQFEIADLPCVGIEIARSGVGTVFLAHYDRAQALNFPSYTWNIAENMRRGWTLWVPESQVALWCIEDAQQVYDLTSSIAGSGAM